MSSKLVYKEFGVEVCSKATKDAMSQERAKELLGWQTEADSGETWKKGEYLLTDLKKDRIRCQNNPTNRPFRINLAKRYANEMLRGKWKFNGEPVIIDRLGNIQSGQHRLIGFVLACQMLEANPRKWEGYGTKGKLSLDILIVTGIHESAEVVDTLDIGQKRSLGDVIFRNQEFDTDSKTTQKSKARFLANAARLVWNRTGGRSVSDAPHFPHSEALDFINTHPDLLTSIDTIWEEEGGSGEEGKRISSFISLGAASGLHYLMCVSGTDQAEYQETGEVNLDMSDKADEFWTLFASGAGLEKDSPILHLRNKLVKVDAGSAVGREEVVATVVNAFNMWAEGKVVEKGSSIVPKKKKNDMGKMVLADDSRLGGLDSLPMISARMEEEEEEEEEATGEQEGEAVEGEALEEGTQEEATGKPEPDSKAPAKGKRAVKGEWNPGDTVWVKEEAETSEPHWFCEILSVDGQTATVKAHDNGEKVSGVDVSAFQLSRPKN